MPLPTIKRLVLLLVVFPALAGMGLAASAHADIGTPVANLEMATLQGSKLPLLAESGSTVLFFFRPRQERSRTALQDLEPCLKEFAGKSLRLVGVVSGSVALPDVSALVQETGFTAPVMIDAGDALYGSLALAMHPVVAVIGPDHKLAAFEPYRTIDFCAVLRSRLHLLLGDISESQMQRTLSPERASEGGQTQLARRYRAMAAMLFNSKNYDKALASVRQSLAHDPNLASAQTLLGQILAAQGHCAQAQAAFQQALALDASLSPASQTASSCPAAG
ncbi:MAG: tetratricopeptide repeat protein [Rhodoferax sp.]|nr:tetratricopeptide repeat protein [Rhodoferax sp.]